MSDADQTEARTGVADAVYEQFFQELRSQGSLTASAAEILEMGIDTGEFEREGALIDVYLSLSGQQ